MKRALMVFIVTCIALGSCTQRLICPAYQSAFIYDKESLRKKFSYFVGDSTPKVLTASKTKFLIAEPTSYYKKVRSLQTVEMKPVYPIVPDSLKDGYVSLAELDSAANSIIDSTYIVDVDQQADTLEHAEDSVYIITKDKEVRLLKYDLDSLKYSVVDVRLNVDQDNYMWYLRDYLVLPDVRLAKLQASGEGAKEVKAKKEKKGFFGFFKNLFKKKKKDIADSSVQEKPVNPDEFDFIDTVQQAQPVVKEPVQVKKKGGLFRKKDKIDKPVVGDDNGEAVTTEERPAKKRKERKKKDKETDPGPGTTEEEVKPEKDDGF